MVRVDPIDFSADVVSFAAAIDRAGSVASVARQFQAFVESEGFTSAACVVLDGGQELSSHNVLMNTRPQAWVDHYVSHGQMAADPVLGAVQRCPRPFVWSEVIDPGRLTATEREVMGSAADFGMAEGFVVPITDGRYTTGLVSLAGPVRRLSDQDRARLALVSVYVHQRLVALSRRPSAGEVPLTRRELEVVRWIAAGKSDWQVGQILSISGKTVNFHVENVKRKFGVASRIQAVVAALNQSGQAH